ncbi:MAG: hypothetical protein ACTSVI_02910 [Promethearchaeota archaeon]
MDPSFFSFDDPPLISKEFDKSKVKYITDPREIGGILVQSKPIDRAKCSICNESLVMEIFYIEGKTRKYVRCEGCKKYLFELEKKKKYY